MPENNGRTPTIKLMLWDDEKMTHVETDPMTLGLHHRTGDSPGIFSEVVLHMFEFESVYYYPALKQVTIYLQKRSKIRQRNVNTRLVACVNSASRKTRKRILMKKIKWLIPAAALLAALLLGNSPADATSTKQIYSSYLSDNMVIVRCKNNLTPHYKTIEGTTAVLVECK